METVENASGCPAIDQLIESSKTFDHGESVEHLKWISYSEFIDIKSIEHSTDNKPTYCATYELVKTYDKLVVVMSLLETVNECTREFIYEFAKTHSLSTHKDHNPPNMNQFRRYSK